MPLQYDEKIAMLLSFERTRLFNRVRKVFLSGEYCIFRGKKDMK
jgi:hypothetical protein